MAARMVFTALSIPFMSIGSAIWDKRGERKDCATVLSVMPRLISSCACKGVMSALRASWEASGDAGFSFQIFIRRHGRISRCKRD